MARDDDILNRLDEHMARSNELMAEVREEHRLNRAAYERGMSLMFDLVQRHERLVDEAVTAIRDLRTEMRAEMRAVREHLDAQTQALFRVIDRLDGGNGAPAT